MKQPLLAALAAAFSLYGQNVLAQSLPGEPTIYLAPRGIGAGMEYPLVVPNWSGKMEYRHTENRPYSNPLANNLNGLHGAEEDSHTLRFGLTYRIPLR